MIKWATKLLVNEKGKGKKRAREKDQNRFAKKPHIIWAFAHALKRI